MKKALIFAVLAAMLFTTSCRSGTKTTVLSQKPSDGGNTATENAVAADTTEDESAGDAENAAGNGLFPIRSIADADAAVEMLVRLPAYDRQEELHGSHSWDSVLCKESGGTDLSYALKKENFQPHSFISTITLGENEQYTFPFAISELEKNGWTAQPTEFNEIEEEYEAEVLGDMDYTNSAGETIHVYFENLTDTVQPLSGCSVTELTADPEVRFRIGDMTQEDVTAEAIIQKLGMPDVIYFTDVDDKCLSHAGCQLIYFFDDTETLQFPFSGLSIDLSEETGLLEDIYMGATVW